VARGVSIQYNTIHPKGLNPAQAQAQRSQRIAHGGFGDCTHPFRQSSGGRIHLHRAVNSGSPFTQGLGERIAGIRTRVSRIPSRCFSTTQATAPRAPKLRPRCQMHGLAR